MSHSLSIKGTQDDPSIGLFLRVQYLSREIQERRQLEEARYAKLHSNYEYICEYCSRSYKLKTDLTHHMKRLLFRVTDLSILQEGSKECEDTRVETPKTWQRNEICAYVPFVPQEVPLQWLDNHLRLYEKDFRCEGCGKEYHGTRESMNHKRFKKPSEDFDLILCQKAFSSCSNFYQHVLTHIRIRRCLRGRFYSAFWDTEDIILDHFRHCNTIHPEIAELARNYLQKL